jgi:hypothetical protein
MPVCDFVIHAANSLLAFAPLRASFQRITAPVSLFDHGPIAPQTEKPQATRHWIG